MEKAIAAHSSTLAWKIPWTEEPVRLQSLGSWRVGRLSDFTLTFHFHALEKEMATYSSVLAWRIPGMGEPGGLLSMGSHRVGHDWSDLAAARGIELGGRQRVQFDHVQFDHVMFDFHYISKWGYQIGYTCLEFRNVKFLNLEVISV